MCSVTAYHESGEVLGILHAQGAWGQTVHTREMRKQINALRDSGDLVVGYQDNPIVALLQYLGSKAHKDAEEKPMKISRNATKLARAAEALIETDINSAIARLALALVPDLPVPVAGTDAASAEWVVLNDVLADPDRLAFDHHRILVRPVGRE